jgi:hypothetical protein
MQKSLWDFYIFVRHVLLLTYMVLCVIALLCKKNYEGGPPWFEILDPPMILGSIIQTRSTKIIMWHVINEERDD